ncbi:molybdopterin cofactor-binding domain-containing protein [Cellulomonas fimi]|uniref:Molybdopterin-dependent oxidoreductase n=1 Tax=Cellulomonas fimi TaxID=1708 RepID=A0A7Y0LVF9_CELFI|nr:molybdopterin cofactor-binding domain-containing protein [Cellulomonas fimi]NMR18956.1 molybdopterin-dependent oxidoreductase [Cellulomonas fimi]
MTSTIGSVPSTEGGGATAEPEREPRAAEAAEATGPSSSFQLVLNGEPVAVEGVEPQTSLLTWLRATGRTGAKEGCAEGDCGACTVTMLTTDAHGRPTFRAVNSCLVLMPMTAGREIVTVEGVAADADLHPVQRAMCARYGSQCGYCTPGFVMSMTEAYYRDDLVAGCTADDAADHTADDAADHTADHTADDAATTSARTRAQVVDQLTGNLCRCTGYRPIRDAMLDALAERSTTTAAPDPLRDRLADPPPPLAPLSYEAHGHRFERPTTLAALLARKAELGAEAELVAGATETGVSINKLGTDHPLLVSVEGVTELAEIEELPHEWRVGGAATLTAVEDRLGPEYPMLARMLRLFASRQIRSRATVAGNLVTAAPIGDLAPVLLALDAEIVLERQGGSRALPLADFFLGYRTTAIEPHEIVRYVVVPRASLADGTVRRADSSKISKRRDMATSIVAGAFVVDTDASGTVTRARIAYGGVAATPVRARRTEEHLVGRPWSEDTLAGALEALGGDVSPIDDHRGGAAYRRDLVAGMLTSFFHDGVGAAQGLPDDFEPTAPWPRDDEGRGLDHESARGHVTGRALYVDDVARRRPMLDAWPVASPHAHARVVSIDTAQALREPGVVAVLTAADVPGSNLIGPVRHDETLFADPDAEYVGHLVALVVGTDVRACRRAAEKVAVEYEPLPAVLGIRAALEQNAFLTTPHVIRRGDCEEALRASPHVLDGELEIGGQDHFSLETHAAWAEVGGDGEVHVASSTQHPAEVQESVARVLGLPRNLVTVESPRMGGAFGGKETQAAGWAALVALAAARTGRPVRLQLDRDVDMRMTGKRHPFLARYSVGFDDDGRLHAVRAALWSDGGWSLDLSESILDRALFHLDNCTYIPAVEITGRVARTNVASNTAFRGFGGPQGMIVIEEILDRVARKLGLAPEVVRERNLYRGTGETNTTHYGQDLLDDRIPVIWDRLMASTDFAARRRDVAEHNARHPHLKRGIAITAVKFGISFTASWLNQAGAYVLVYRDGTVQVNHGGTEMGQGLYTKVRGIAMRELGLPVGAVRVMSTRTDKVPNTSATAASSGSDLNGQAVKDACVTLRGRLAPVAAHLLALASAAATRDGAPAGAAGGASGAPPGPTVPTGSVVFRDGHVSTPQAPGITIPFAVVVEEAYLQQLPLFAAGYYATPGIGYDKVAGRGRPFHYYAHGAAVTEVEVDGLTGAERVLAVDILHDVGDTLNHGIDRGQIEGGFIQGMGYLTGEELRWDDAGALLTHAAGTYQIPSIGDVPPRFDVTLLPDVPQDGVIHGSKAVGEPPLMLAISVREAIRDAIAAFGEPGGEVPLPSPATHEAILAAVRARTGAGVR